ncbi:hypothetical protein [Microbacterium sp. MM2322]|uniref:hypothetical protein n=1 Tax=Microbacterium sp. MM2322 TaxID=3157631 RepID=UPI0032D57870
MTTRVVLWVTVAALVVVAVVLAPVVTVTAFGDGPDGSVEVISVRSLVGIPTGVPLWLAVSAVVLVAGLLAGATARRRRIA